MEVPMVAVVGRPNVGKSTLFNRLLGRVLAIVEDRPGVTRDRLMAPCTWNGHTFQLVDTGGLLGDRTDPFLASVTQQAEAAIAAADVILFLLDVKQGVTSPDEEVTAKLRRVKKPVVLVVNKVDNQKQRMMAYDAYRLGLTHVHMISALHGIGTGDLLDQLVELLPRGEESPAEKPETPDQEGKGRVVRIAIVGRPNVGKSSLYNALLGEERVIVDETAGTTRDAIDTSLSYQGKDYILIDTAGMRRRSRIDERTEYVSVLYAIRALERADVVCMVWDASQEVSAQDLRIADLVQQTGKPLLCVVNKWDIVRSGGSMGAWKKALIQRIPAWDHVPVRFVSALTGWHIGELLPYMRHLDELQRQNFPTPMLNSLLQAAQQRTPPPPRRGKVFRIYYATQTGTCPPRILLFVNEPGRAHWSYLRHLENCLRTALPLEGIPLRMHLRKREQGTAKNNEGLQRK
ncbi:ribosome biogenesis GTPase Der [Pasteuria penetrans]|uniref:ribosome biogenesis GTPase Der n=1 Tax=Pasteuria penetrans TaxID=86005 RepID=UPI000F9E5D40|nr:ribosome biogenesis GTPase Der [Pasteuria penetrans]